MVANKAARLLIRRLELYGNLSDDDKAVLLGMDAATRTIRAGKDLVLEGAMREWLVNLGTRRAPSRVAHLICGLLVRLRAVGLADFDSFDFPLTQVDLADTLGMSTVHMNRSLQDLRSAQLIELCRNRLTIPNSAKLEAFARSRVRFPHLERTAA